MQVKKQQSELDMEQLTGSKLGNENVKAVYCHPVVLNLYAKYIMRNARLDESQCGIKIARRNIHNLRHADDATTTEESEEELKSLLMKVKESEKTGLNLNIQKTKILATSANRRIKIGSSDRFYVLGLQNHWGQRLQPWN